MDTVPVLVNHDHARPIGTLRVEKGCLRVKLAVPLTQEQIFDVFGAVGFRPMEYKLADNNEDILYIEIEILEFSLLPTAPGPLPDVFQ